MEILYKWSHVICTHIPINPALPPVTDSPWPVSSLLLKPHLCTGQGPSTAHAALPWQSRIREEEVIGSEEEASERQNPLGRQNRVGVSVWLTTTKIRIGLWESEGSPGESFSVELDSSSLGRSLLIHPFVSLRQRNSRATLILPGVGGLYRDSDRLDGGREWFKAVSSSPSGL